MNDGTPLNLSEKDKLKSRLINGSQNYFRVNALASENDRVRYDVVNNSGDAVTVSGKS